MLQQAQHKFTGMTENINLDLLNDDYIIHQL